MNKTEFIKAIAEKTGLSKKDAAAAVAAALETITDTIKEDTVSLSGFGTFGCKHRLAREGKNPRTGEMVNISAANVPIRKSRSSMVITLPDAVSNTRNPSAEVVGATVVAVVVAVVAVVVEGAGSSAADNRPYAGRGSNNKMSAVRMVRLTYPFI